MNHFTYEDNNGPYEVLISNADPAIFKVLTTVTTIASNVYTTSQNHKLKITIFVNQIEPPEAKSSVAEVMPPFIKFLINKTAEAVFETVIVVVRQMLRARVGDRKSVV